MIESLRDKAAGRLSSLILGSAPAPVGRDADVEIHMLTGKRDLLMLLWALKTFFHFSRLKLPVVIHDDGSLADRETALLRHHFPGVRIVPEAEAQSLLLPQLAPYPLSHAYRRKGVLSRKLFDFYMIGRSQRVLFLDTDILFFHAPEELAAAIGDPGSCRVSEDNVTSYYVSVEDAKKIMGLDLKPKINSGLALIDRSWFSLEKIEYFLKWGLSICDPSWGQDLKRAEASLGQGKLTEQTANAMLWSERLFSFLPETYSVTLGDAAYRRFVCRHYVSVPRVRRLYFGEGAPWVLRHTDFAKACGIPFSKIDRLLAGFLLAGHADA